MQLVNGLIRFGELSVALDSKIQLGSSGKSLDCLIVEKPTPAFFGASLLAGILLDSCLKRWGRGRNPPSAGA
jgi:hypothetical protein